MTHLIRALLYRISYRHYLQHGANRYVTGKDLRPQTYRPKRIQRIRNAAGQGDAWHDPASHG